MSESTPAQIAIAIVHRVDSVLVGVRSEEIVLAGMAEFPGGKIQPGESPENAAARDCLEETGIAVRVERLRQRLQFEYPHGTLDLHFFNCVPLEAEATPINGFRWVSRDQLAGLEFPAANREVIESLQSLQ